MPLLWTIEVEYDTPQPIVMPILVDVQNLLDDLYKASNLKTYDVTRKVNEPTHYNYVWTVADGRQWKQELQFDGNDDPLMDFSMHGEFFRESEFAAHRKLRILMVTLINAYGLKKFKATT